MANSSPNLKVNIGADTSQFTKGVKEARRELKDFEKTGNDALSSVGNALGVNTSKLEQMASAARGMGTRMKESSNESVQALGSILTKINGVTTAIAGIGIGAAVTAFKLLNQEASWFKSTIEGANIDMATAAYVKAYSDTLHSLNVSTGKSIADAGANIKKALGVVGSTFKTALLGTMTGGAPNFAVALTGMGPQIKEGLENAEKAERISNQIFEINKKILEQSTQMTETDAKIAELRRIAADPLESASVRLAAINQATALIKQKYEGPDGLIALNEQLSALQKELYDLPGSGMKDLQAVTDQKNKTIALTEQEANELRTLQKTQGSLNAAVSKEAEERAKALAAVAAEAKALADSREALASLDLSTSGSLASLLPGSIAGPDSAIEVKFRPVLEEEGVIDLTRQLTDLAEGMSAALGGLIGDLMTGGDAWGNFKSAALGSLGDMAIAIGKIFMEAGIGSEAVKMALGSLQGFGAIAAGAALIALGTAVKTGLANVAQGNYSSASASVASSGYGAARNGNNGGYTMREMTVNVTGTLKADGDQLITVINNTNKRNSYTQ